MNVDFLLTGVWLMGSVVRQQPSLGSEMPPQKTEGQASPFAISTNQTTAV